MEGNGQPRPGAAAGPRRALSREYEAWIATAAAAGIAAHLLLRHALRADPAWWPVPLAPALLAGGIPLTAKAAARALRREPGADLLAAVSIVAALALGLPLVSALLVLMLSGGAALERAAARRASGALEALAARMPRIAHRREGGSIKDVELREVSVGDALVVFPHELCPADGIVREGQGSMDESYLTGEPFQLPKGPGSAVLSGAVNGESVLTVSALKAAADSRYAAILRVMEESVQRRPRLRRLADQLGAWYAPLGLASAAAAWAATGDPARGLAVLVAATPCPLILAIPVAVLGAISTAARRGIIIRDPAVLEQIPRCRVAIFDKTGTLTYGKPTLTEVRCFPGHVRAEVLSLASSLERFSRHPLAAAVREAAAEEGVPEREISEVRERPGRGLEGKVAGKSVRITGRSQAEAAGWRPGPSLGGLECVVMIDGTLAAVLSFRDAPRHESRPFLDHLPRMHGVRRLLLLSGDRESEVRYLAEAVGIAEVEAGCSPERKVAVVAEHAAAEPTLFVGDGINDAPALLRATVGVAIGAGSDVASSAAGAVILTPSLGKVDELLHIGRRMRAIALESAVLGMALSLAAMAAAAAGALTPLQGAVAQELIDLAAIANALRAASPGRLTDF